MTFGSASKSFVIALTLVVGLQASSEANPSQTLGKMRRGSWIKQQQIFSFSGFPKGSGTILPIDGNDLGIPATMGPNPQQPEGTVTITRPAVSSTALPTYEYFFGYATEECTNLDEALEKIDTGRKGSQKFTLFTGDVFDLSTGFDYAYRGITKKWKAPKGEKGTLVLKQVKTERANDIQLRITSEFTFIHLTAGVSKKRLSKVSCRQTVAYDPPLGEMTSGTILPIDKTKGGG